MEPQRQEYKGRRIELRSSETGTRRQAREKPDAKAELLIDDQSVRYYQLPDGSYALHEYAYDWTTDLIDLARRFIDHQDRAKDIRLKGGGQ